MADRHFQSEDKMSDKSSTTVARRSFLTRLGAGISVAGASLVVGAPEAAAQAASASGSGGRFQAARHTQDDWMDQVPGKHRFVFDTTSAAGFGSAVAYANNFLTASESGYGLKDPDGAVIVVARHFATPFAYKDAIWAKYGGVLTGVTSLNDPKTKQPPTLNLFNAAGYDDLRQYGHDRRHSDQARRAIRRLPDGHEVFFGHARQVERRECRCHLQRNSGQSGPELAHRAGRNRRSQPRAGARVYARICGLVSVGVQAFRPAPGSAFSDAGRKACTTPERERFGPGRER